MARTSVGQLFATFLVAALVLGWFWSGQSAPAQAVKEGKPANQANVKLKQLYYGNDFCASAGCHDLKKEPPPNEAKVDKVSVVLSRRIEWHLWNESDKHKIATKVLTEGRGKEIAGRLKITADIKEAPTNKEWRQCLSCHGVLINDAKYVDKDSFGPEERVASGVSCVVCHGAYFDWVDKHRPVPLNPWPELKREDKELQYGLRDLWDPQKRAELCCSCHVGDGDEKVVTHEMYAAGHPPLPGFEIITFSAAMPRHWETLADKYQRLGGLKKYKDLYDKIYDFGEPHDVHQIHLLLTSAIVAFRNSVGMIAVHADAGQKAGKGGAKAGDHSWPEFALYDCYACHHDLKAKSWRQERGYAGAPGRPQMRSWPTVLLPLALPHGGPPDFTERMKGLEAAFSETPFGKPDKVQKEATALVEWSDRLLKELAKTRLKQNQSREWLAHLVHRPDKELLDFDSARQLAWATKALLDEINLHPKAAEAPLVRLRNQLNLKLLEGPREIVPEYLPATLSKLADYDPVAFRNTMKELAAAIGKEK
jgi:hypothetical protein